MHFALISMEPAFIDNFQTKPYKDTYYHEACQVMTNGDHKGWVFSVPSSHKQWIPSLTHHFYIQ